jgi:hypothetical protein
VAQTNVASFVFHIDDIIFGISFDNIGTLPTACTETILVAIVPKYV